MSVPTVAVPAPTGSTIGVRNMSVTTTLHWIFRVAICMEFVGHGAFGIIGKEAWVPYFSVFGFTDSQAWTLMPLVGAVDISLGMISLFRPTRAVLLHMTFWGLMTAMLRPATGEPIWELFERGGNYAVPLAFLFLVGGGGRSFKGWFASATPTLNRITAQRMGSTLRIGTALLLVGHGGFGAFMHREAWTGYFAELGVAPLSPFREELDALLLVGVVAGHDGERWLAGVVDGLVGHVGGDEQEVTLLQNQAILQRRPVADVDPPFHHVDSGLESTVGVGFGGAVRRDDD